MPAKNEVVDFSFSETLIALKGGAVLGELSERLKTLIQAVRATEKGGSLQITLKVSPATSGTAEVVTVEAVVKETVPKPSLGKTVFFTTDTGGLTRQNPDQLSLLPGGN